MSEHVCKRTLRTDRLKENSFQMEQLWKVQSAQRHVGAAACPAPAPAPARQVHVPAMVGIRSAI
eukprot:2529959-Amphidinium_carterae.1